MTGASIILTVVAVVFITVTVGMLFMVAVIGTNFLKTAQFWMSSLSYNAEMDGKVQLLLEKVKSGLCTARKFDNTIEFFDADKNRLGVIWTKTKYHHYGHLTRYGDHTVSPSRTSLKTFYKVIELEKYLEVKAKEVSEPTTNKKNGAESVILE